MGVVYEEDGSSIGEKVQCYSPAAEDLSGINDDLEYKIQLGRKINRSPNTSKETTTGLGFEVEGEDGTCVGRSVRPEVERSGKDERTRPISSAECRRPNPNLKRRCNSGRVKLAGQIEGRVQLLT